MDKLALSEIAQAIYEHAQPRAFDYFTLIITTLSVCISALAVIMAVQVPKKIAITHNKIDLFEKRYELYLEFVTPLNNLFTSVKHFQDRGQGEFSDYILKSYESLDNCSIKNLIDENTECCFTHENDELSLRANIKLSNMAHKASLIYDDIDRESLSESLHKMIFLFAEVVSRDRYRDKDDSEYIYDENKMMKKFNKINSTLRTELNKMEEQLNL